MYTDQDQLALEREMEAMKIKDDQQRLIKIRERGQESSSKAGNKLVLTAIQTLAETVSSYLKALGSKEGPRHAAAQYLEQLEPEVTALLIARTTIDSIAARRDLTKVALAVAGALIDEINFRRWSVENKALYETLRKDLKRRTHSYRHQRRVMISRMQKAGHMAEDVTTRDKILLGTKCVDLMIAATDLVKVTRYSKGAKDTRLYVEAKEGLLEKLADWHEKESLLRPTYLPMIVQPAEWVTPYDGGYLTPRIGQKNFVKTGNKRYLLDLDKVKMPEVYRAINLLQAVPWQINSPVMETMVDVWNQGGDRAGLPRTVDYDMPVKVGFTLDTDQSNMTEVERAALQDWKRQAAIVHNINHAMGSKRLAQEKKLFIANKFKDHEAIYFPHCLDWRGRAYPIPLFLNPQGDDAAKGLLRFAKGKALGEQGACWLAIHGANLAGEDKVSLQDRIDWTVENSERICAVAHDPLGQPWWQDVDSPFQFLAFCFEWEGYCREGVEFVSHLPVSLDGSCNGLQNFAALLRDETSARAVNLYQGDKPADVYQNVADSVVSKLEATEELDQQWLTFGVDRKVVKRPVMTLPYGATRYGFVNQIMADTLNPARQEKDFPFEADGFLAARALAEKVWDAINSEVPAAIRCMDWLQECASVCSKAARPIHWVSPMGFPVFQEYNKQRSVRVKTSINNQNVRLSYREATERLDKRRQTNGIAPNFVHSLDAAHLQRTVLLFEENLPGMSFAAVHDSFGTHAADVELMGVVIRLAFKQQYEQPILEGFTEHLALQLDQTQMEQVPALPARGSYVLAEVIEANYFFA